MEEHKVLHDHVEGVIAWANDIAKKYHGANNVAAIFEVIHLCTLYKMESFETPEIKLREIVDVHYGEASARAKAWNGGNENKVGRIK